MVKRIIDFNTNITLDRNVACIGNFDGLHEGHKKLIDKTLSLSKEKDLKSAFICFDKDPYEVITNNKIKHIISNNRKYELINNYGFDYLLIIKFNKDVMNLKPDEFIDLYLNRFNIDTLISGFDFSFGYKGKGNVKDLRKYGRFNNIVIEEYKYYGKKISSTRIKANIIKGNFKLVERLLGYPYIISLKVIKSYKKDNNYLIEALPQDNTLIVPNNGIYNDFEIKDNIFYINSKSNIKTNKIIEFRYINE